MPLIRQRLVYRVCMQRIHAGFFYMYHRGFHERIEREPKHQ